MSDEAVADALLAAAPEELACEAAEEAAASALAEVLFASDDELPDGDPPDDEQPVSSALPAIVMPAIPVSFSISRLEYSRSFALFTIMVPRFLP